MKTSIHSPRSASRVERYEAVVIGGGQAALAVGHHLAVREVDFVILSDEGRIGDNWRRRWDSLRLFTPARYSGLPGMSFPAPPDHFGDKDEMAAYLERYVTRFDLPVRLNTRVRSLGRVGTRYSIRTECETSRIEADNVIVATGAFQAPRIPAVSKRLGDHIHQLHSTEYHNPFDLPPGAVLVVGAGSSGAQIALELARYRKVWLAGRDTGHMPRRLLGRDIFDWLWPVMRWATADTRLGRRMRRRIHDSGEAPVGIAERELTSAGVVRVARVDDVRGGLPLCGDDVIDPKVIIWCTGFQPDHAWIDLPVLDEKGMPRHVRGEVHESPGLFFVGLRFQYRLNSSLVGGVGEDAKFVAERVAKRVEQADGAMAHQ